MWPSTLLIPEDKTHEPLSLTHIGAPTTIHIRYPFEPQQETEIARLDFTRSWSLLSHFDDSANNCLKWPTRVISIKPANFD